MNKKKIVLIHSVPMTVLRMRSEFPAIFPEVQLINILDDGILPEVDANNGKVTPGIVSRVSEYVKIAQDYNAKAVMCLCTTVAPVMKTAALAVSIPVLQIDYPMMEQAVKAGKRIAVICTAQTTLQSSAETARNAADALGCQADIKSILVENAFVAAQIEGNMEKHDKLVIEKVQSIAKEFDVFVLAQVSMIHLAEKLAFLNKPVFTSIPSGMNQLKPYLQGD